MHFLNVAKCRNMFLFRHASVYLAPVKDQNELLQIFSDHWMRGVVHLGQVVVHHRCLQREMRDRQPFTRTFTTVNILEFLIKPTCMLSICGREPEHPGSTHTCTGRELHTEAPS